LSAAGGGGTLNSPEEDVSLLGTGDLFAYINTLSAVCMDASGGIISYY